MESQSRQPKQVIDTEVNKQSIARITIPGAVPAGNRIKATYPLTSRPSLPTT